MTHRKTVSILLAAALILLCSSSVLAGVPGSGAQLVESSLAGAQRTYSGIAEQIAGPSSSETSTDSPMRSADDLMDTIQGWQTGRSRAGGLIWDEVKAQFPNLPVVELPVPASQVGPVSWQTYGMLMYEQGFVLIPFRQNGTQISPEEEAFTAVEVGQHTIVASVQTSTPVALGDIVANGSSGDPGPSEPMPAVTWNDVLAAYPGAEIISQQIKPNELVWLTLVLDFLEDGYTVLGFDSSGQAVLPSEMGMKLIQPGDHMAIFRTEDTELVGLVDFVSSIPAPGPSLPSPSPDGTIQLPAGWPAPRPGSGLNLVQTAAGPALRGIVLRNGSATVVTDVTGGFTIPEGSSCVITDASGSSVAGKRPVCTGDQLILTSASGEKRTFIVIVTGDVLGTGKMSLSQLVRLAQGFTRTKPLEGAYYLAGCWTGNTISLTDLVKEAQILSGQSRILL